MRISDWSSDVCSSDLARNEPSTTTSTTPAITTPTASPTPRICGTPCEISVENATSTPSIGSERKCAMTACFELSASSRRGLVNETLTSAVAPSSDTTRIRSEEHTSKLQSLMRISYAVFCLQKKKAHKYNTGEKQRKQHENINHN